MKTAQNTFEIFTSRVGYFYAVVYILKVQALVIFLKLWFFEQKVLSVFLVFQNGFDLTQLQVNRCRYQKIERDLIKSVRTWFFLLLA